MVTIVPNVILSESDCTDPNNHHKELGENKKHQPNNYKNHEKLKNRKIINL
ncbi:hypothetical protein PLUTE_b0874 [Pseudoalteromonas luteoviolacea DSM 6061]|nr:hypothetical protein [Pseudoalteromonas luteoviolacea DSM 6061]